MKSPDYIADRVTGHPREVDVSIRTTVGSTEVLVVIECRDRNDVEDTRWIEQVIQKTRDLKAHKVLVVSSSGFTAEAKEKAAFYSIDTRSLEEITVEDIRDWLRLETIRTVVGRLHVERASFTLEQTTSRVHPKVQKILQRGTLALTEPILLRKKDRARCGMEAVHDLLIELPGLFNGVPDDGTRIGRGMTLQFTNPADRFQLPSKRTPPIDILAMHLAVELWHESGSVPIDKVYSYGAPSGSIGHAIQWKMDINGAETQTSLVRDARSGRVTLTVRPTRKTEDGS